jgi:hypothetical protein
MNSLGSFGVASNTNTVEKARSSQGSALGQSFGSGGKGWNGSIWGSSAIGSGFGNSAVDSIRSRGKHGPTNPYHTRVLTSDHRREFQPCVQFGRLRGQVWIWLTCTLLRVRWLE